jgi:hypothetical protein
LGLFGPFYGDYSFIEQRTCAEAIYELFLLLRRAEFDLSESAEFDLSEVTEELDLSEAKDMKRRYTHLAQITATISAMSMNPIFSQWFENTEDPEKIDFVDAVRNPALEKYNKLDAYLETGEVLIKRMSAGLMRKLKDEIPEIHRQDVLGSMFYIATAGSVPTPTENQKVFIEMFASEIGVESDELQNMFDAFAAISTDSVPTKKTQNHSSK